MNEDGEDDCGDSKSVKGGQSGQGRKRKLSASTDARSTTTGRPSAKYQGIYSDFTPKVQITLC